MSAIDPTRRREVESAGRGHRAGRLREAVAAYENLLRRAPDDPDLMQLLGVALGQLGNHLGGARLLARSLELKPDRPTVLLNLAQALRALAREEEALRCCDPALALDQSLPAVYLTHEPALAALGRRQEALANYGQAVRLPPRNAPAHAD